MASETENALASAGIQLAPMYKCGRHGRATTRLAWPWLAANNCQLQGQLLQQRVRALAVLRHWLEPALLFPTSPSPRNPRPSPPYKNFRQPQSFSCNSGPKCTSLQTNGSPSRPLIYALNIALVSARRQVQTCLVFWIWNLVSVHRHFEGDLNGVNFLNLGQFGVKWTRNGLKRPKQV